LSKVEGRLDTGERFFRPSSANDDDLPVPEHAAHEALGNRDAFDLGEQDLD
jgi:hypothetical protein